VSQCRPAKIFGWCGVVRFLTFARFRSPRFSEFFKHTRTNLRFAGFAVAAARRASQPRKQGKKFGRPERLDAGQKRVIADRYGQGATIPELAEEYGVGVGTIWRSLQPLEAATA
jgi:hypothetical protein